MKKFKNIIIIFLITTFIMPQCLFAYSEHIIAGGENIGLKVTNNGVIVAGFYKVNNGYPGKEAGFYKGDIIVKSNNKMINSIDDFISSIEECNEKKLSITFKRNDKEKNTTLNLIEEDGNLKTGLYVKDSVSGIGTLTFIDPNTKLYGALGHEILESSTGTLINVKEGQIYDSKVTSIERSTRGEPGAKNASVDSNKVYGNIKENTISGIFGNYTSEINKNKLYKVADYDEIKLGNAKIITVLEDNLKKEYDINIIKVNNNKNDNKNILFEVTDKKLIEMTGGIIQGMSGSPIIQGDKIIGAVTNVVVNEPTKGYGILITSMLEEAED